MPAPGPMVSSSAMRISFPSTMPATRKIPKNSSEFCDQRRVGLAVDLGETSDIAQTAIGIAIR